MSLSLAAEFNQSFKKPVVNIQIFLIQWISEQLAKREL